jgi:hypothetical protein
MQPSAGGTFGCLRDQALRKKLTPKDQPMCKRLVFAGN